MCDIYFKESAENQNQNQYSTVATVNMMPELVKDMFSLYNTDTKEWHNLNRVVNISESRKKIPF